MRDRKQQAMLIETPEGISFSLTLAGPAVRAVSWVIDVSILIACQFVLIFAVVLMGAVSTDFSGTFYFISTFLLWFGYYVLLEWKWGGRTVGKRAMRLRVIDDSGLRLQFSQVLLRNIVRVFDGIPFGLIGGLSCWLSSRSKRLGDMVAGTVVVRYAEETIPDLERLDSDKYNSLRDHPNLVARIREAVSPQEAGFCLAALIGRGGYGDAERVELFRFIAGYIRECVDLPDDVVYGMSDEKLVHNIVDLLFHQ